MTLKLQPLGSVIPLDIAEKLLLHINNEMEQKGIEHCDFCPVDDLFVIAKPNIDKIAYAVICTDLECISRKGINDATPTLEGIYSIDESSS